MRRAAVPLVFLMLAGCAGDPPPAPRTASASKQETKKTADSAPAPRCSPSAEHAPSDARPKMRHLGDEVRRCFLLGTRSSGDVEVELRIAESGNVTAAEIVRAPKNAGAIACSQRALRGSTFSSFCGDDITIRWTYRLASD